MGGPDDADNAFVSTAIYFRPSTASGFGLSFVMPSKRALLTALTVVLCVTAAASMFSALVCVLTSACGWSGRLRKVFLTFEFQGMQECWLDIILSMLNALRAPHKRGSGFAALTRCDAVWWLRPGWSGRKRRNSKCVTCSC